MEYCFGVELDAPVLDLGKQHMMLTGMRAKAMQRPVNYKDKLGMVDQLGQDEAAATESQWKPNVGPQAIWVRIIPKATPRATHQ